MGPSDSTDWHPDPVLQACAQQLVETSDDLVREVRVSPGLLVARFSAARYRHGAFVAGNYLLLLLRRRSSAPAPCQNP